MKKLVVVTALITVAASAGEPQQCPNPDEINGLLFRGSNNLKFTWSPDITPKLTGFAAPATFRSIGTAVRQDGRVTRVAYRTDRPIDEAYVATIAAMGEGWEEESPPLTIATELARLQGMVMSGTLCRDGQRRSVVVEDVAGVRYASVNLTDELEARGCKASLPDYMPRIEFPAGSIVLKGGGPRRNTFGTAGASIRLRSDSSAQQLADMLAAQLIAQGWRRDAAWSGKGSVGSTWRKASEGRPGTGTLEVTRIGESVYDVDVGVVLGD